MPPVPPSLDEVLSWFTTLSNWGRWGADDRLGTLNHISPEARARAAALVREGAAVSCGWDIDTTPAVDHAFGAPQRFMLGTGQGLADPHRLGGPSRWAGASEFLGMVFHGYSVTHLDALSHVFWDGHMYNGVPAEAVTSAQGATVHDVRSAGEGVLTRGVLLDVSTCRGGEWLEPGQGVFPDDLEAAEDRQGVKVGPGDAVLLRTGYGARKRRHGPDDTARVGRAGWHVACAPWLHARDVALIGADTAQDVHPSGYPSMRSPLHYLGIAAMGLWLLDNCDLEGLTEACAARGRWEFCFAAAPLRFAGSTGSPVNPLALF